MSDRPGRSGVGFVGFRTTRFAEMVRLFRDLIGLDVIHEAPGAIWFRLGTNAELHVYAADDPGLIRPAFGAGAGAFARRGVRIHIR